MRLGDFSRQMVQQEAGSSSPVFLIELAVFSEHSNLPALPLRVSHC